MASLDRHEVDKAIYDALAGNTAVKTALGDPPRIRYFLESDITFPCCRVDGLAVDPWTGTMRGPGVDWIRRVRKQFTIFSQETSLDEVSSCMKAIEDVLELIPSNAVASITGGVFGSAICGISMMDYDPEVGSAFGVLEYTFSIEAT